METEFRTLPNLDRIFFIDGRIPRRNHSNQDGTTFEITREFHEDFMSYAKDLFLLNREAAALDGKVRLLRYVGFGVHVFECNLRQSGTEDHNLPETLSIPDSEDDPTAPVQYAQVTKLSLSETMVISDHIRNLAMGYEPEQFL